MWASALRCAQIDESLHQISIQCRWKKPALLDPCRRGRDLVEVAPTFTDEQAAILMQVGRRTGFVVFGSSM